MDVLLSWHCGPHNYEGVSLMQALAVFSCILFAGVQSILAPPVCMTFAAPPSYMLIMPFNRSTNLSRTDKEPVPN